MAALDTASGEAVLYEDLLFFRGISKSLMLSERKHDENNILCKEMLHFKGALFYPPYLCGVGVYILPRLHKRSILRWKTRGAIFAFVVSLSFVWELCYCGQLQLSLEVSQPGE